MKSHKKGRLDITAALRILKHAGREEPESTADEDAKLQSIIDALCDLSVHDGLTGLVNATFFHAALTREIDRGLRTGRTCGLMVIDIDHFKDVNDTYGHQAGDQVLQCVARQMDRSLRSMDTAARIGGEEFAVILPECSPENAVQASKRIHAALNPLAVSADAKTFNVTTSAGVVWTSVRIPMTSATLLARGDRQMYRAKRLGRGRLCHPPLRTIQVSTEERVALTSVPREEDRDGA